MDVPHTFTHQTRETMLKLLTKAKVNLDLETVLINANTYSPTIFDALNDGMCELVEGL